MSTASGLDAPALNRPWILAVLCAGQAMVFVDVSVVNVALPSIGIDLGIAENQLQSLVTTYGATLGGLLVLAGRLGDLLGHRRTLRTGVLLFVAASIIAGTATLPAQLVAARAGQGAGAALMTPAGLAILNSVFPDGPERVRAFGVWGALGGIGAIAGVILSGALTEVIGWRSIFLINVPLGVAVLLGLHRLVPAHRPTAPGPRLDLAGGALIAGGLLGICFGLGHLAEGADRTTGVMLCAAGLICLLSAALLEPRVRSPIIPASLFSRPGLTPVLMLTVLAFGTLLTLFFFASLYLTQVLGLSPILTGLAYVPVAVTVTIGSIAGSRLAQHWGSVRLLPLAFSLSALGTAAMALGAPAQAYPVSLLPGFIVTGLGIGASFVALQIAVMDRVTEREAGVIGGIFSTSQEAGGALVLALVSTTVFVANDGLASATQWGFAIACCLALVAVIASATRCLSTRRQTAPRSIL